MVIDIASGVLARAPEWIRQDLAAKDNVVRVRAEEALAAMIAAALEQQGGGAGVEGW